MILIKKDCYGNGGGGIILVVGKDGVSYAQIALGIPGGRCNGERALAHAVGLTDLAAREQAHMRPILSPSDSAALPAVAAALRTLGLTAAHSETLRALTAADIEVETPEEARALGELLVGRGVVARNQESGEVRIFVLGEGVLPGVVTQVQRRLNNGVHFSEHGRENPQLWGGFRRVGPRLAMAPDADADAKKRADQCRIDGTSTVVVVALAMPPPHTQPSP